MKKEHVSPHLRPSFRVTRHLLERLDARGIDLEDVVTTVTYGRRFFVDSAVHYVMGWRDVERCAQEGLDLRGAENIHVLCSTDGSILTAYKNQKMPQTRPRHRHRIFRRRRAYR